MKNFRLLALALSICFCAACTSGNKDKSDSHTPSDSVEESSHGVGAAPDSSKAVGDSLTQQADTTTLKKP